MIWIVDRIDKDYERTKSNLASQRDKIEDTYKREIEQHTARKSDLNRQLEDMQTKLKVIINDLIMIALAVTWGIRNEWAHLRTKSPTSSWSRRVRKLRGGN